ncbi:MAG: hypothetical protein GX352_04990 [Clostridiales bacterium]|nr:hypothetical protein [Clostridiales bacterium]
MEKKNLLINAAVCDARNVSEATLESYKDININAAMVIVSQQTKDLLAKYNVSMNTAEAIEAPKGVEIMVQNGSYEIKDNTLLSKSVILIVNGSLNIETRSKEVLDKFINIQVNGSVSYPNDIKDRLPVIKVNGSTDSYPGDAIRLKNKLVVDKTFILRAKGEKYYVRSKVVIADKDLNVALLNEMGTKFITKKAVIAEGLLEEALALFDEHTEIKTIPDGLVYTSDQVLSNALIRKHGDKLYVDGDLIIDHEGEAALDNLSRAKIEGTLFISSKLVEKLHDLDVEYNDLEETKGHRMGDRAFLTIDKRKLDKYADGIGVFDCGIVSIKDDITPEEIEEKLEFVDCGVINCNEDQKSAIETVSKDVGMISDNQNGKLGTLKGLMGGLMGDKDTKVINAATYTM